MARIISVQELVAAGVTQNATAVAAALNKPKPRVRWWMFQAVEADAIKMAKAHPELIFVPRYKARVKKEAAK